MDFLARDVMNAPSVQPILDTNPADSLCAILVTYHPTETMLGHIPRILAQVRALIVVDNGSSPEQVCLLRKASGTQGFALIENCENLGIAEALNQGVLWAKAQGYLWVILFDQDSIITDGFIDRMERAWQTHPQRERVVSVHPRYLNPATGAEPAVRRARDGGPIVSLTSGALMPTWIFDRIGCFQADYFIDEVDTEYCLRIRAAGYLIADSTEAHLYHGAGSPQAASFLGFHFQPSHHSAVRRYYISRNRIVVYRKYIRIFPAWVCQLISISLRETIKCFAAEQDRARKLHNFLLGTWDGFTGKMGRKEGL